MKKAATMLLICASVFLPVCVPAQEQENREKSAYVLKFFLTENGEGKEVRVLAGEDTVYIKAKEACLYTKPGEKSREICRMLPGEKFFRVAVCNNGWSKGYYIDEDGEKHIGYVKDTVLGKSSGVEKKDEKVTIAKDCDILDFPARKEGTVVGELLEMDQVTLTATVDNVWSRILYQDDNGSEQTGYIPTSVLEGEAQREFSNKIVEVGERSAAAAGVLSKGDGTGVFAEALKAEDQEKVVNGVQIGRPVAASSEASLKPLGTFRITHYCPCSICCGPWADGITSTGVTATTNHTIAVDPSQIPYGSKVVINGQVYVAEDCGGAIKENCIDIYVATHEEGEGKGVYYTDVYLIQE